MRSVIIPIVAAVFLALNVAPTVAQAGDVTPRCPVPVDTSLSRLLSSAPDAVVYEYRGRDAAVGIRIFNALPPRGLGDGDRFYIAMRPAFPISRLIVASHGCVSNAMLVDVRVAFAIRKAIKQAAMTLTGL
ncbi:MAG TPA: hypothetical protein VHQ39_04760 [Dongiaceae bacterium]|jgi:hypothetical protein|nr:hypothetical protein [Dongiaceae bacterium]